MYFFFSSSSIPIHWGRKGPRRRAKSSNINIMTMMTFCAIHECTDITSIMFDQKVNITLALEIDAGTMTHIFYLQQQTQL